MVKLRAIRFLAIGVLAVVIASSLVHRPLAAAPPVTTKTFEGEYVVLEVPEWYSSTIIDYDVLGIVDRGFLLEKEFFQSNPSGNLKQVIAYDSSIDPDTAQSGNPILMGANWWAKNQPPWFAYFHEIGHNFLEPQGSYHTLVGEGGQQLFAFDEGFASLGYLYTSHSYQAQPDHFGIKSRGYGSLMDEFDRQSNRFNSALLNYRENGNRYSWMDADVVDGILLELAQEHGWDIYGRFFRFFANWNGYHSQLISEATTPEKRIAFIVAALSAAANSSMISDFSTMNFPIDTAFFDEVSQTLSAGPRVSMETTEVTTGIKYETSTLPVFPSSFDARRFTVLASVVILLALLALLLATTIVGKKKARR